ncbi:MAG: hypothetical protein KAU58_02865 [Candidatus Omnitrophica bacterium]|nr:hypothetical protein [Candidatus Omnitrophota bacterium]
MRLLLKLPLILACILLSIAVIFLSLKSGDLLIGYLANSLGFKAFYSNRCGFASTFIFKTAHLKSFVLEATENPLKIKCVNADIKFDYSKTLTKGVIGLRCRFNKPIFSGKSTSGEEAATFLETLPSILFSMLGETANLQYDDIFCDLLMYGDTAEILLFTANSRHVIMRVKGKVTTDGQVDVDLKAYFSPEFIANFSDEVKLLLEEETSGWMSFRTGIKSSKEKAFLELDSDRFRLSIGEN